MKKTATVTKRHSDWTTDGNGYVNSSRAYLAAVDEVKRHLAYCRLGDDLDQQARMIVSALAHGSLKMAPKP